MAHETDQYSLPVGREFADLGPYVSKLVEAAVLAATQSTNAEISAALSSDRPDAALALQSSDYLASMVWAELFRSFPTNGLLDGALQSAGLRERFPGLVTLHEPMPSVYDSPLLLLDLSKIVRSALRAGTVTVGGTLIGTDKIIHFVNLGRIYHAAYEAQRAKGRTTADATALAVAATSANPLYSEDGFLGTFTTGVRSNADLAANLAGLKFYRNLSETVRIGPREWPPMLVRDGAFWRVQMPPDSQRFTAFVTPHWNEVLNPNKYLHYVALQVRETVQQRCADVLDGYRDRHGRKRSRAQFEAIEVDLATYFGEPYDHQRNDAGRVSVAELCFDGEGLAAQADESGTADALGRTPLWWAAHDGRLDEIERLITSGQDVARSDVDGDTPLHAALRAGQIDAAWRLLLLGSPVDTPALYGVTPLMLATVHGQFGMVQALLEAGARPDRSDPFGRTPLHVAIDSGQDAITNLLLRHGADPRQVNDMGNSAAHLAARHGNGKLLDQLAAMAALSTATNARGATPADEAARQGHLQLAESLHAAQAAKALPGAASHAIAAAPMQAKAFPNEAVPPAEEHVP